MIRIARVMAAASFPLVVLGSASADPVPNTVVTNSAGAPHNPSYRSVNYQHDDGTVDSAAGVGAFTFDIIWLNRFSVAPGGEVITDIQAAIGSPGQTRDYNGLAMTILVYEDADGDDPSNATLVSSTNAVVSNANTGLLNNYDIADVTITTSDFLVAVVMRNLFGNADYPAPIALTGSYVEDVSYFGGWGDPDFNGPLDETDLASIGPVPIESFGINGNWVLRATGSPIPGPASLALVAIGGLIASRRQRT